MHEEEGCENNMKLPYRNRLVELGLDCLAQGHLLGSCDSDNVPLVPIKLRSMYVR